MDVFFDGIKFFLGLQLIFVAIVHCIYKANTSRVILASLCLVLGLWFFNMVFHEKWENSLSLFLLIGSGKTIFLAPLIFIYLQSLRKLISTQTLVKHLLIPFLYIVIIGILRYELTDLYENNKRFFTVIFQSIISLTFLYYFFVTIKELRKETKNLFIPKAYNKLLALFYCSYFFLLQIPILYLFYAWINEEYLLSNQSDNYFLAINLPAIISKIIPVLYLYFYILGYVIFLYALSESLLFKKLSLPKNISYGKDLNSRLSLLNNMITTQIVVNKKFKDSSLNAQKCAEILNVPKRELIDYLKLTQKATFTEYINKIRINEFKKLILNENYTNLDLVGLAKECGFNSRSTFFRVFKEIEGLTPNEYKKNLLAEN